MILRVFRAILIRVMSTLWLLNNFVVHITFVERDGRIGGRERTSRCERSKVMFFQLFFYSIQETICHSIVRSSRITSFSISLVTLKDTWYLSCVLAHLSYIAYTINTRYSKEYERKSFAFRGGTQLRVSANIRARACVRAYVLARVQARSLYMYVRKVMNCMGSGYYSTFIRQSYTYIDQLH